MPVRLIASTPWVIVLITDDIAAALFATCPEILLYACNNTAISLATKGAASDVPLFVTMTPASL